MFEWVALGLFLAAGSGTPASTKAASVAKTPHPEIQAQLSQVTALCDAQDWAKARAAAQALEAVIARLSPLEIVECVPLAGPPEGLGMYHPLVLGEVKGEELWLYAQVRNHGMRQVAGFWELHLVSDLVIFDGQGKEIARDVGFGESRFNARAEQRDTFVVIALRTKGLPKGDYRARLILHDRIGQKDAQADVAFHIK
jgi:hypothetical protein